MLFDKLTTNERLSKVKIQLQEEQPFWAYLILKLRMQEDTQNKIPNGCGMGVNAKGDMFWKKKFVDEIKDDNQLKFCLAHEVGHLVFGHLMRLGNRNPMKFNIASDAVLNNVLIHNGFKPISKGIIPKNDELTIFGITIKNINQLTAEEVYDLIPDDKLPPQEQMFEYSFDNHGYGNDMTQQELESAMEKWSENLIEAAVYAKNRGKLPRGMESLIDKFINPKYNWKQMLRKYIVNVLPFDYSFSRPNRKIPNIILPGSLKESVDIVVHIDTSGSISDKELTEFMSEIIGIATSHHNINMTLIECDAKIQQVIDVNSRNIKKLKSIKVKGRGGTSHKPVFSWIKKHKPQCKLFISLTDLYSDIEKSDKLKATVLWLVPKGNHEDKVPFGRIMELR